MKCSVIIPSYNDAPVLKRCLNALNEQDFKEDFEVIVVDDGSTDDTRELLKDWEKKEKKFDLQTHTQEKRGAACARNQGIQMATGELVLFIGADILVSKQWLKEHVDFHKETKEAVAVGFMTWSPELQGDRFRFFLEEKGLSISFKGLKDKSETDFWHFYTGNISMPKKLLKNYNFDEDFKNYGWEDILLGYRMTLDGTKIFYLKNASAYHHHALSESDFFPGRMRKIGESAVLFDQKFPECGVLPKGLKKFAFSILARLAKPLSFLKKEWGWYALSKKHFLEGMKSASKKTVLIIGSYGAGNLGDEAMLEVMLRELSPDYKCVVLSGNVQDTNKRHAIQAHAHFPFGFRSFLRFTWMKSLQALRHTDVVVLGGGGLFTDSQSKKAVYLWAWHVFVAKLFFKPVIVFANSFGPVEGKLEKIVTRWALRRCQKIILRDEQSKHELEKLGTFEAHVGFDPVILFSSPLPNKGARKIAVNLRPLKGKFEAEQFIADLKEQAKGYELVFYATEPIDKKVMAPFGTVFYPKDFAELISLLNECEYCIGMRLHFLIAGVLAGCKVYGISYSLKVSGILRALSLPFTSVGDLNAKWMEAKTAQNLAKAQGTAREMFSLFKSLLRGKNPVK